MNAVFEHDSHSYLLFRIWTGYRHCSATSPSTHIQLETVDTNTFTLRICWPIYVQGRTYVLYAREGYKKHRILNVNYISLDVRFPIYKFTCNDKCTFNAVQIYTSKALALSLIGAGMAIFKAGASAMTDVTFRARVFFRSLTFSLCIRILMGATFGSGSSRRLRKSRYQPHAPRPTLQAPRHKTQHRSKGRDKKTLYSATVVA